MSQITIPAPIITEVRSGAHSTLGLAAQAVSQASERPSRETDPSCYAEPLRAFDGARELLNRIGWRTNGEAAHVAADCVPALLEALAEAACMNLENVALTDYAYSLTRWAGEPRDKG